VSKDIEMFTVRTATISDAQTLGDVFVRSARFAYAETGSPQYLASLDPAQQSERYETLIPQQKHGHYRILIAEDNAVPTGLAELERSPNDPNWGLLQRLFFVPESLGKGLGPIVHAAVIDELRAWGCTHARLTYVQGTTRARPFYIKHGWQETGEEIPFDDHGNVLFDIVMTRAIEQAT
jgi:GNAT superfamily N-acetyltransferase